MPLTALALEVLRARFRQLVVLASPSCFRFAPNCLHETVAFEAVQNRIEHAVGPRELAARQFADTLDDGVTVAIAFAQDGENQRCCRGSDEIFVYFHCRLPRSTIHCTSRYVYANLLPHARGT